MLKPNLKGTIVCAEMSWMWKHGRYKQGERPGNMVTFQICNLFNYI